MYDNLHPAPKLSDFVVAMQHPRQHIAWRHVLSVVVSLRNMKRGLESIMSFKDEYDAFRKAFLREKRLALKK